MFYYVQIELNGLIIALDRNSFVEAVDSARVVQRQHHGWKSEYVVRQVPEMRRVRAADHQSRNYWQFTESSANGPSNILVKECAWRSSFKQLNNVFSLTGFA
jgi:hypothetical protein